MAFELLNTFKFLDPVILTGRRKVFTASGTSVFSNSGSFSYETFNVENASVQPVAKDTQILQADGIREYEAYFVYTSTPLKSSEEATLELADQIQIDGKYLILPKTSPIKMKEKLRFDGVIKTAVISPA